MDQMVLRVKLLQSCPTICDTMDCSPSGSSVHGILQAGILEWIVISFSRASFLPRDQTWVSESQAKGPKPNPGGLSPSPMY